MQSEQILLRGEVPVHERAKKIVKELAKGCSSSDGHGSFTMAIYDTAWLSMVQKEVNGVRQWLFPQCFDLILREQMDNGGWQSYGNRIDEILNSLAALLSLQVHLLGHQSHELEQRSIKAQSAIARMLDSWDVVNTVHVGFEILVPSLLGQLEKYSVVFDFPAKQHLLDLKKTKMARFRIDMLYSERATTFLHSLEAFVHELDFDRVRHHRRSSGLLASPSSTAAYLIRITNWDDEAERYLRAVVDRNEGSVDGVPSAFPTTIFEISWTLSTLLLYGFKRDDFDEDDLKTTASYLTDALNAQNGIVGFSSGIVPDADDTAKSLLALALLGYTVDTRPLLDNFNSDSWFRTYQLESSPSFSANCNVLNAILNVEAPELNQDAVLKAGRFLCSQMDNNAVVRDKWNLSPQYCSMLVTHGLVSFLKQWDEGNLPNSPDDFARSEVPIALSQVLSRTLAMQLENGSWDDSVEVTAYSTLVIAECLKIPWPTKLRGICEEVLMRARQYLGDHQKNWTEAGYLWVEKVTYGSPILGEMYCLAAMRAPYKQLEWSEPFRAIFDISATTTSKVARFFANLPILKGLSSAALEIAAMEAFLYFQRLRTVRLDVFPQNLLREDKYLEYIPLTWTACNQLTMQSQSFDSHLPGRVLWEMMVISMLQYQVDEYMETIVGHLSEPGVELLKTIIQSECGIANGWERSVPCGMRLLQQEQSGHCSSGTYTSSTGKFDLSTVELTLKRYISYIVNNRVMLDSPEPARQFVATEVCAFILSHITHNRDNASLVAQNHNRFTKRPNHDHKRTTMDEVGVTYDETLNSVVAPTSSIATFESTCSYLDWARTTGSDDTSCPSSFAFYLCLIGRSGKGYRIHGAKARYLSQSLGRHLATMCRQYNDIGSFARDQEEENLNSLNFGEFANSTYGRDYNLKRRINDIPEKSPSSTTGSRCVEIEEAKADLLEIAQFERACTEAAKDRLATLIDDKSTNAAIQTFINVTDLYGQIYVARDITQR